MGIGEGGKLGEGGGCKEGGERDAGVVDCSYVDEVVD